MRALSSAASMARRCIIARLAMPAGRASMQMTLASQGRSASALTGALSGSGTVTLESAAHHRTRSARLRGRDPRQRRRAGDRRRTIAADRRAGAVGRRVVGHVGANSVQHQRRPASRRRHHARAEGMRAPSYPAATIFPPTRPTFAPTGVDGGRTGDQPSGNPVVRGRFARRARSHRRRRGAVVMAGGAGDRSRNPPAGFDRARRDCRRRFRRMQPRRMRPCPANRSRMHRCPAAIRGGCSRSPGPVFRVRQPLQRRRHRRSAANSSGTAYANAPVVSQQVAPLPPPIEVRPAPGVLRPPKLRPPLVLTPPPQATAPPRPLY